MERKTKPLLNSIFDRNFYKSVFKGRLASNTKDNYPDLLSIHIPKTAGRTFREILKSQYGDDKVLSLDHHYLAKRNEVLLDYPTQHYPVVHGHLPYSMISTVSTSSSKYITWLRQPVERVLSNYYFYCTIEFPNLQKNDPDKELIPLHKFIRRRQRRNLISAYLKGINLEDFFFVGFQETFASDIQVLGQKLDWRIDQSLLELRVNDNKKARTKMPAPSTEVIEAIKTYNQEDIFLYEKAQQLANQGYWN